MGIAYVPFTRADTISIMADCGLEVVYMLGEVKANRLYLEYEKVETVGLPNDAPMLPFTKIRANLIGSSLAGGYSGLFKTFCNPLL